MAAQKIELLTTIAPVAIATGANKDESGEPWIPPTGTRITFRVPQDVASVNFPEIQYGTAYVPVGGRRRGTFWVERPNGGVRMVDVANYIAAGVTWVPWHKSHGWEKPTNDTRAKRLAKLQAKLERKKRGQVVRKQMEYED